MAVYTTIRKDEIVKFLTQYNLGKLISYSGIIEGIENTNYNLITDTGKFILTIFEKRVDLKDLPFFTNLQKYLSDNGFRCPIPVQNNNRVFISSLRNKKSVIVSFLEVKKLINQCLSIAYKLEN